MSTETDDDFGPFDLDDMPGIPPLVRNARVAADLLFVDPPPAYAVRVTEHRVGIQGRDEDGLVEWCERHRLDEIDGWESDSLRWREFRGVIEDVPFEVTCEVAKVATCDKPSCDNHAEPNTSHGLCPSCEEARS